MISLFTTDAEIVSITKGSILLVAVCIVPDSIKGMMKGAIKALGAQDTCAKINLLGHWGINLTLQLVLAVYLNMHVPGQWTAKIVLELYILTAYSLLVYLQDWENVSLEVKKRLEQEQQKEQKQTPAESILSSTAGSEMENDYAVDHETQRLLDDQI